MKKMALKNTQKFYGILQKERQKLGDSLGEDAKVFTVQRSPESDEFPTEMWLVWVFEIFLTHTCGLENLL